MKKGSHHTKEAKQKNSETQKRLGIKPPSRLGMKNSIEHIKKVVEKNRGKKRTEETRQLMSLNSARFWKGKKQTKEHIENSAKTRRGKPRLEETKQKISIIKKGKPHYNQRGENAYTWKGGITPENVKIRNSIEYKLFIDSVFARDGYTCQKYGIKGVKLNVHHILNFSEHSELRFAIDNGITLSEKAHKEFHKIYGKKNNTREQIEEFLLSNYK